ncbi:MAG: hypothetical protein HN368_24370, partial [Spirochaetales bacterium]|nr:hypothetical protein [Spirochaetales bacterium]
MKKMKSMEPDDLFKLKFLQNGSFSPDGNSIVYTVTHVDTEADKEFSSLMLWSADSSDSRMLTTGKAKDSSPCFAPDGKSIAFLSDRKEKPQVFILPLNGGDARQLTDMKQGVGGGPVWSPDGANIAFTAGPGFGDEDPPDLTKQAYRVNRKVYRFDGVGYLDQKVQDIYVIGAAGGEPKQLTDNRFNSYDLKWSPDGSRLMFLESMNPDSFRMMQPVIKIIDMDGMITSPPGDDFLAQAAEWMPNGKLLAVVGKPDDGSPIGSKNDLWVLDLEDGGLENRTAGLTVGVGGTLSMRMPAKGLSGIKLLIIDSGDSVYIRVQAGGTVHVYLISLTG